MTKAIYSEGNPSQGLSTFQVKILELLFDSFQRMKEHNSFAHRTEISRNSDIL